MVLSSGFFIKKPLSKISINRLIIDVEKFIIINTTFDVVILTLTCNKFRNEVNKTNILRLIIFIIKLLLFYKFKIIAFNKQQYNGFQGGQIFLEKILK